jgi:hypothetical protein
MASDSWYEQISCKHIVRPVASPVTEWDCVLMQADRQRDLALQLLSCVGRMLLNKRKSAGVSYWYHYLTLRCSV